MEIIVSVVTPVYNSSAFLEKCIESVLDQSFSEFEFLLIDDCSTDNSAEIIKYYSKRDPRIKYLKLLKNSGAGVARNKGIELALGQYLAFLDSDDIWHRDKLKLQLEFMKSKNAKLSFTSYECIDESDRRTGEVIMARKRITYRDALWYNPIGCLTAVYDMDFFGKVYMPKLRKRQDYALWLKLLRKADAFGLELPLAFYRNTSDSISSNKIDLIRYQWKLYYEEEGLNLFKSLFYTGTSVTRKIIQIIKAKLKL